MKNLRTEIICLTFTGPAKNREKALNALKRLGYSHDFGSVPWREAFPDHDQSREAGECLAGARHREGITQLELARVTGIPQRHISEMETGKRVIGKKAAGKFGKALNADYRIFL
jgi:DNA-binding XRE family transcriptional regulator